MNKHHYITLAMFVAITTAAFAEQPAFGPAAAIVREQCVDCHNNSEQEGGFNLERFASLDDAMQDRAAWKRVFDVVEAGQMPLQDSGYELDESQRASLLDFVRDLQAQPDPTLGAIDPGKPVLRRLTRLEYNNTVRDLFEIDYDVFMFPERLPISDKQYFLSAKDSLGDWVKTSTREYGQKYNVLLPQHGLPGDNRAEYGYANRGDALNLSPLLLEKYLEVAAAIAGSERLLRDSIVMQDLLGIEPPPASVVKTPASTNPKVASSSVYAPNNNIAKQAEGNDTWKDAFVSELTDAFEHGSGGVFDVPANLSNKTIAGKGGLLKVQVGSSTLTINPNIDLWLAAFATAEETSGDLLLTNRTKNEKTFELTFAIEGDRDRRIDHVGVCVLARRNQKGEVSVTAVLDSGHELTRTATIGESGNTFYSFAAAPGTSIKRLRVDGSRFSGDHVLVDDIGFILNRVNTPITNREVEDDPVETPQSDPIASETPKPRELRMVQPLPSRIATFLTRAYRRVPTAEEIAGAVELVREASTNSEDDSQATIAGLRRLVQSTLTSPEFLFIAEPIREGEGTVRKLNDFELASRLSYFLWSSMPDSELLEIAHRGTAVPAVKHQNHGGDHRATLISPVLLTQTRRMIGDRERARELSESFAVQWLRLDQLYTAKPDRELFKSFYSGPQGKSTLHSPMMTEALLLFETVLVEDRSVLELIDPSFTWLNPQLAGLYDLRSTYKDHLKTLQEQGQVPSDIADKQAGQYWVRCELPDRNRGGVMTMAGPLTLTSLPFRTSPIKRGAWLLETVFNRPPAEPKVAFVLDDKPDSEDSEVTSLSIRQRFEKHRTDPNCNSCHSRIDPPGFSLESFDAIGGWRSHEGSQPVDASGEWNGQAFSGPAGFKAALRAGDREFVRGLTEHLMSYALGRQLEHYDMPAVDQIVENAAEHDYRISSLIEGIVASYPFQHVRNVP